MTYRNLSELSNCMVGFVVVDFWSTFTLLHWEILWKSMMNDKFWKSGNPAVR